MHKSRIQTVVTIMAAMVLAPTVVERNQRYRAIAAAEEAEPIPAASARIKDVAWIAGTWRMKDGEDILEERWVAPLGDCMVATLRWLRADGVWMYELMTISEDEGRLVFRIKHFTRTLAGWEPKKEPVPYPIVRLAPDKVVFENPEHDQPRRFMYERIGADTLVVSFESIEDGKTKRQEFRFSRAEP